MRKIGSSHRSPRSEQEAAFRDSLDKLAVLGGFANHVSMEHTGLPTTVAGELASIVFAKMCAHVRSIGAITQSSMFDHSAILALSRMVVEASTMITYLRENVDEELWSFRYLVLKLHDTVTRIKLVRGLRGQVATQDLKAGRTEIQNKLKMHSCFLSLDPEQQDRLLTGEEVFVGGMRRAAQNGMGWDGDRFTSLYGYLSAHAHSSPMSYTMARKQQIDYLEPNEAQYGHAALAIEITIGCLRRVVLWTVDDHPELLGKFHAGLLAEWRDEDDQTTLFGGVSSVR